MKLKYDNTCGWGNIVIHLSDFLYTCNRHNEISIIQESITCIHGFKISNEETHNVYSPNIYINEMTFQYIHPLMRTFITPTPEIERRVMENIHNCDIGVHIRRGKYGTDSYEIGFGDAAYHCSDTALTKFMEIIKNTPGPIFLASDSLELKKEIQAKLPEKIKIFTVEKVVLTSKDYKDDSNYLTDAYVEWFLLSKCKKLYITAGNRDLKGFSTYGYTAGVYGKSDIIFVFNN